MAMTDEIKKQIAKSSDRKHVFGLLQKMDQKMIQVEFRSPSANGEFMVEKGRRVFWAKTTGDGDNGMMAMMKLLAAQKLSFGVMPTPVEKPKSNVDFNLAELVEDEPRIIQQIKDILWPVNEADAVTEARIEPIKVPAEKKAPKQEPDAPAAVAAQMPVECEPAPFSLEDSIIETETAIPPLTADGQDRQPEPELFLSAADQEITQPPFFPDKPAEPPVQAAPAQPTAAELNMLEQMVLTAAAEQQAAIAAGEDPAPKRSKPAEPRPDMILEESSETDDITFKRRAEMKALEVWCGEEPDKFFEEGEHPIEEDDVFAQRRAEMKALNDMLEAHANLSKEIFQEQRENARDEQNERRRREFEALKEYFAENPERFYEYVSLGEDDPNGTEELRNKILAAMAATTRDVEAFEATDGRVMDESVLRPVWSPEMDAPKPEPEPEPIAKNPEDEYVPPDLEPSPFGDETSTLNYDQKHKGKLDTSAAPVGDDLSLIKRNPNPNNQFGFIDRSKLRMVEKLPKHVLIAAAVFACLMPIMALYLYHYFNMNAEADYEDERAASELASKAAQEESTSRKTEQSYRTAEAGPVNSTPPSARASGNELSATEGSVTKNELSNYRYVPSDHPQPMPTRAQSERAQRCLAQGEQMLAIGQPQEAVRVFADGLLECPNNPILRIRTARTYMMLKQYGAAKDILISGMHQAASQAEFDAYLIIMKELPRI
jgi:hypothetical protein